MCLLYIFDRDILGSFSIWPLLSSTSYDNNPGKAIILFYTFISKYNIVSYQKAPLLLNGYTNIVIPVLEVGLGFLGQILDKNNLNRCHIFTSENIYNNMA